MKNIMFLLVCFCLLASGATRAFADIGPKPTIDITLPSTLAGKVKDGELLLCKKEDCSDAETLKPLGPQRFGCDDTSCHGLAYGFTPYLQLKLSLGFLKSLTSPVFTKKAFNAQFKAELVNDRLIVTEQ